MAAAQRLTNNRPKAAIRSSAPLPFEIRSQTALAATSGLLWGLGPAPARRVAAPAHRFSWQGPCTARDGSRPPLFVAGPLPGSVGEMAPRTLFVRLRCGDGIAGPAYRMRSRAGPLASVRQRAALRVLFARRRAEAAPGAVLLGAGGDSGAAILLSTFTRSRAGRPPRASSAAVSCAMTPRGPSLKSRSLAVEAARVRPSLRPRRVATNPGRPDLAAGRVAMCGSRDRARVVLIWVRSAPGRVAGGRFSGRQRRQFCSVRKRRQQKAALA